MHGIGFPAHFRQHLFVYVLIACFCFTAALTLFQLTEPRSDTPRVLLIETGIPVPDIPHDASVQHAEAGSAASPELVQAYVLMTGGGTFDIFCAPASLARELNDQQLIRPLNLLTENCLRINGAPMGIRIDAEYALFAAASADEAADSVIQQLAERFSNRKEQ